MARIHRDPSNIHKVMTLCQMALLGRKGLSYTGFPSVSVLFLRSNCTPLRHFMLLLRRIWLSLSVLMFLGELWGLLTNFCWSSQRTSLNRLAWGLFQCMCPTSGIPFHLRLFLKSSLRPIFFDKPMFRLFGFFRFLGLVNFLTFLNFSFFILL